MLDFRKLPIKLCIGAATHGEHSRLAVKSARWLVICLTLVDETKRV